MGNDNKKADEVVFNEKEGYNSKVLPYGSNISAPAIKIDDISTWKAVGVQKLNKQFFAKYGELKDEYNKLLEEYKYNELVYKASFNFEPLIGNVYYLYEKKKGDMFLSLIEPHQWNKKHIGTFKLNSERKWIKL